MSNHVYANGREVSCKAAAGKSICAFPDVCLSPPTPPAGPIPIPYPNTGMASDTSSGSKTVQISNKEVMLKDSSSFQKSTGDEAATKSQGMNVITHQIQGKCYFTSWSMDVKIEGENAVRHLDLMTHNHASGPGGTPTWPYADRMAMAQGASDKCKDEIQAVEDECEQDKNGNVKCPCGNNVGAVKRAKNMPKGASKNASLVKTFSNYSECMANDDCSAAAKCVLSKKDPSTCCKPQTPHHIVPGSQFRDEAGASLHATYVYNDAPCICVEGNSQTQGSHGGIHFETARMTKNRFPPANKPFGGGERWTVGEAEDVGARAVHNEFPQCSRKCIEAQVRQNHQAMGVNSTDTIRPTAPGPTAHPNDTSVT